MPEIIGQDPKNQVTCGNCGAKLRFTRDEVRAGEEMPQSLDGDHKSVIACPQCHRTVDVTSKVGVTTSEVATRQRRYDDDI